MSKAEKRQLDLSCLDFNANANVSQCCSHGIAWASVYYLSPKVLRLRGLIVLPEYRRMNYMTSLLRHIIYNYKGRAEKLLSFATKDAKPFHEKFGFKKAEGFEARPVEHFEIVTNTYTCNPDALLTLYYYLL